MKNIFYIILTICIVMITASVAFYFLRFLPEMEKNKLNMQQALQREENEQKQKDYVSKRKKECYSIYEKERNKWNNVDGQFYNIENDECVIRYTTDKYKGIDCNKEYKDISSLKLECEMGIFTARF